MESAITEQYLKLLYDQLMSYQFELCEVDATCNSYASLNAINCKPSKTKEPNYLKYNMYPGNEKQQFWQPWLNIQHAEDAAVGKSGKQLPTAKWKRDRRGRPDYMRKSDQKMVLHSHETNGGNGTDKSSSSSSQASSLPAQPNSSSVISNQGKRDKTKGAGDKLGDSPLDMTTTPRQRGLPPSYSQAISDPSFRSSYANNRLNVNPRDELPTGISMCDPIIDEHFRRSLGKDYNTVFNNNAKENLLKVKVSSPSALPSPTETVAAPVVVEIPKAKSPPKSPVPVTSVIEMMDSSGLSVDDHFAKALGDTWHKLNKKKSNSPENSNVNSISNNATEIIST